MSFIKIGTIVKQAKFEVLPNLEQWTNFVKQASSVPQQKLEQTKEAIEKEADFEVVASIDPAKFIYIHSTIMAGVRTEDNNYWVTPETEKYANDNNDAWTCEDLLTDHKSFKRATTFVEHDQKLENAKGKCIDVIARNMGDTLLIDVLFSVDKRHKDLVANIENGIINAVSMGCSTAKTICSICGKESSTPEDYCQHLKSGNKGRFFVCADGKKRKAVEVCKNNTFFDVSLVANPAFAGAVFRKILSSSEVSNQLLANILNSKIESYINNNETILKAASISDIINISLKQNGTIEINSNNQKYIAKEAMNSEEIENFKKSMQNFNQTKETPKITLAKILETVFGKKEATHPINNESPKKDFSITDQNYNDIPYRDRHNTLPQATVGAKRDLPEAELKINNPIELRIIEIFADNKHEASRVKEFKCLKCGYTEELWKVKASSIDYGFKENYECPQCLFIMDASLFEDFKHIHKTSKHWFDNFKNNNYTFNYKQANIDNENFVIVSNNGKVILAYNTNKNEIHSDYEISKLEKTNNILIATRDIPVEFDEDCYWFDKHGNTVISKNEKVSFVTTVENGKYGLFKTVKGEDFFMPMAYVTNNNFLDVLANEEETEEKEEQK
jgi:hypothetical protein